MTTSFISHALILDDLFDARFQYTIPLYQRPYSWSIKESGRLLDDLINAMGDDETRFDVDTYFLGAIILTGTKEQLSHQKHKGQLLEAFRRILSGDTTPAPQLTGDFAVVDGKQRLITLKMILCLLRDMMPAPEHAAFHPLVGDGGDGNAYRLNLSGGEKDFFHDHVLAEGATQKSVDTEDLPDSQKNITLARDKLFETLQDLTPEERRKLFTYITRNCEIVIILTEEFSNAYQIFLSINDRGSQLTPGDVLKAELMSGIPANLVSQYNSIWVQWNDSLGEPETNRRGNKTFFNHLWYVLSSTPTKMLDDIRKAVDVAGGSIPFIDNHLVPLARAYEIIKSKNWPHEPYKAEMNYYLGLLDWLPQDEWMSSAMLAIKNFGDDPERSLLFFRLLERLAYGLLILPMGAKNRRRRYNAVRRGLRDAASGKDPFQEIQLLPVEEAKIYGILATGLHRTHSPAAKLILMRLDLHASRKPFAHYDEAEQSESMSVEHLLPRKPAKNSKWMVSFPDPTERETRMELLGNLFLVRDKSENGAMKNFDYPIKHGILFDDKPEHPMALTEELRSIADWTPSQMDTRHQKTLAVVNELWGFGRASA